MEKKKALAKIKETWKKRSLSLEEKIITISDVFDKSGLDIATTATFIEATPAEFDAFISLSKLDKNIIIEISKVNPSKTTWPLLASANDDEIKKALAALSDSTKTKKKKETLSEMVVRNMKEGSGDSPESSLSQLTEIDLLNLLKKGKYFQLIDEWREKFLTNIANQQKIRKPLSLKQIDSLKSILIEFADNNVIKRNSIDGDKELCDKVLDAIGR